MKYEEFDTKEVQKIRKRVDSDSKLLEDVIKQIINPYCKNLDEYVTFITDVLQDVGNPPTTAELEDFCMHLSTDIYWASGMCERLGLKDDISKALYKEMYNTARDNEISGTVVDKNVIAELASQQEYLTNVCYSRAYKIMKAKVEAAQELLGSCKKVLSHRMQEEELTRIGGK